MDLDNFDLVSITNISKISSKKEETLYDITVDSKDHSFFINLPNTNIDILVHNCDGIHISSMLLGWWKKLAPNLFKDHKIYKLNTPIVIIKDKKDKIVNWFFTLDSFKKWESENKDSSLKIIYLKGLGSLEVADLDYIISKIGFDSLLDEFELDDESDKLFNEWLGPDSEPRKKYLKDYFFDINSL